MEDMYVSFFFPLENFFLIFAIEREICVNSKELC